MLSPYLTKCLHHVIKYALTIYEENLHNFWKHVHIIFEGVFTLFMKTYFLQCFKYIYTFFEESVSGYGISTKV